MGGIESDDEKDKHTEEDVQVATSDYVKNLTKSFSENWNPDTWAAVNPLLALLFDTNREVNYNVAEAVHAAAAEFLVQDAIKLVSYNDDESIALMLGIKESEVTSNMRRALQRGGTTVKLAAATVGDKVIQNLGIIIDNEAQREAISTAFGMTALEGLVGTYIEKATYKTESVGSKDFLAAEIPFIRGIQKTSETSADGLFDKLDAVREVVKVLEETRGVEIDKSHGYRKVRTTGNRKVQIRRKEFLSAPKDHTDAVNILENAPMNFNSGHAVFMNMFSTDGVLDADKIVDRLLGPVEELTNFDARERYKAQKEAVLRNVKFYAEAAEDVGDDELFFDWFIATDHRIHLDSNRLNPQTDKQIARWLVTGASSRTELDRSDITAAVNGDAGATRKAVLFAYAIVQAFDGAKIDGVNIVSIDKSGQEAILADAKKLLALDEEALKELSLSTDHLGHSCLGIANILKYQDATGVFESDIVLETDGLTNGFAFRSLQYPIFSEDIGIEEWLEKVGVVLPSSKYYNTADSMNTVIGSGLSDVYVTVGKFFGKAMGETRSSLTGNSLGWVTLLERYAGKGGLPNFSEDTPEVKKFIRNLTKSPVTVFNYAASPLNIAADLVSDQVRGNGYMKGRGIVDLLTAKDGDKYLVTEKELKKQFGNDVGAKYHKARVALNEQSLDDYTNRDIKVLRTDLTAAISDLYAGPLVDTLNGLFGPQAEINQTMIHAAQFMFEHFKTLYDTWKQHPDNRNATAEDKREFLAEIVNSIPGVAGASSSSDSDKIAFLKNMLEPTNHDVRVGFPGQPGSSANTISRGFREPGVAPAVLTVLGLDSSILAQTIVQGYRNDGNVTLPVHDAEVKGIGEYNNTELYNRNFYTSNRSYSILQGFVDAITQLENDPNATKLPLQLQVDGKKKRVTFERMAELLRSKNDEVQKARAVIFSQDMKVGQMVGENGSMMDTRVDDDTKPTPRNKAPKATSTKPTSTKTTTKTPKEANIAVKDYSLVD